MNLLQIFKAQETLTETSFQRKWLGYHFWIEFNELNYNEDSSNIFNIYINDNGHRSIINKVSHDELVKIMSTLTLHKSFMMYLKNLFSVFFQYLIQRFLKDSYDFSLQRAFDDFGIKGLLINKGYKKTPINSSWKNIPKSYNKNFNGYTFREVRHFPTLDEQAQQLKVCSSGRGDLVQKFYEGNLLRYSIHKGNELIATIALVPCIVHKNYHKPFQFYALLKNHIYINDEYKNINTELSEAFALFQKDIISKNVSYNETQLTLTNFYTH